MALDMNAAVKIQASVDGIASINGLEKSLDRVDKQAGGLQGTFNRVKGAAGGLTSSLGGLVPAIGLAGLGALGKRSIDAADNLNDLSQRTGVGVETLDKFGKAANDSGSSLEEVAKSMGKLAKGIVDPASKTNEALKSIGVSSTDAQGKIRGVDAIMLDLADKFSKMPDGVEKTALAMEIFGKSGANIIPMLNEGKEALNGYSATIDKDMAEAADKFNDSINKVTSSISGPFNQAITALLPTITKLAEGIAAAATAFSKLPEPVQTIIGAVAGLAAAFVVLAPAINAIIGIFTALGGLFAGGGVFATIAGSLGALGPVVAAIGSALSGLGTILVGIFTGPVGWAALLIAAGVAIYAFRDQIGQAFGAIGQLISQAFTGLMELIKTVFVQPMIDLWNNVLREPITGFFEFVKGVFDFGFKAIYAIAWQIFVQPYINLWNNVLREPVTAMFNWATTTFNTAFKGLISLLNTVFIQPWVNLWNNVLRTPVTAAVTWLQGIWTGITKFFNEKVIAPIRTAWIALTEFLPKAMQNLAQNVQNIWNNVVNTIKNAIRGVLQFIANALNGIARNVNALIRTFNKLPGPNIPLVPTLNVPRFADGGVVNRPTLAMVGEGGQPEYIVPQSKAANFASNYLGGMRGNAAIQSQSSNSSTSPTIQIQTGPVLQQNNQQYVTIADMEKALTTLTDSLLLNNRTFGGRSYQGVGA